MTFGEYVKEERFNLGYKLQDAAEIIGISKVQLSNIENNKNTPSAITFGKIVTKLNLDKEKAYELLKQKEN